MRAGHLPVRGSVSHVWRVDPLCDNALGTSIPAPGALGLGVLARFGGRVLAENHQFYSVISMVTFLEDDLCLSVKTWRVGGGRTQVFSSAPKCFQGCNS